MGRQCDDRTDDRLCDRVDTDGRHQKGDDRIAQDGFIWRLEEDPDAAQHTDRVDRRTGQTGNQRRCIFVSVKQLFIDPAAAIAQCDARHEGDQQARPVSLHAAHGKEGREAEAGDRRLKGRVIERAESHHEAQGRSIAFAQCHRADDDRDVQHRNAQKTDA